MLLNDSSVLLTSLQNDVSYDPSEQMAAKEDSFTRSNFVANKTEENPKPKGDTQSVAVNRNGPTNFTSETAAAVPKKDEVAAANRNTTFAHFGPSKVDQSKINFFKKRDFEKLPDISSTTKLYSKHANRSAENFASFTSPLGAKAIGDMYGDEEVQASESRGNNSNLVKANYDYDDSFTKLLISNGILKPENLTSKSAVLASVVQNDPRTQNFAKEANPSVEDINRIMDGSVAVVIRNNTSELRNDEGKVFRIL